MFPKKTIKTVLISEKTQILCGFSGRKRAAPDKPHVAASSAGNFPLQSIPHFLIMKEKVYTV